MIRVGALDCGTNSIRLLIADVDAATGELVDVVRRNEVVRLGQGVDRTGRIAAEAMARTMRVTAEYAGVCREQGVERVRFVATSATRDAENRAEFVAGVRDLLGVEPEVIEGAEEASLSFDGATRELLADGQTGPFVVVDIGGGSTEVVRGSRGVEASRSVDVGSVRLTERHLAGDPPSEPEVLAARTDVEEALDEVEEVVPLAGAGTLVGLAGSVTTVMACALDLARYDPAAIHRSRLPVTEVRDACDRLLGMSRAQRAALPYMHPGRVDVIGAGALVWWAVIDRLVERSNITHVMVSEHDILDGIAFSIASSE